eukprot:CAMPEP_0114254852 /NCGR_PEP_ID=MMETSP0058-20121206/17229_1 /TAXON_ID=36894 /ORGANISM="Pyramimonas parkeae, CCMP726" /LENGTH=139 /DNA_ID=CAMNT_0001369157 /DNA_START=66 /DNA_END=485 /DNA_ORIENTATION=+
MASVARSAGGTPSARQILSRGMAAAASNPTTVGVVKWFNVEKGFGFIQPADGGADVFVHQTSIHADGFRSLDVGEEVEFRTEEQDGRTRAVDVTGPNGAYVKGAPRRQPRFEDGDGYGNRSFGGGRDGGRGRNNFDDDF